MKMIKLAHPSQVREVPDHDVDRLLAQGWVTIGKPVSPSAIRQRRYRDRSKRDGYKLFGAWVPVEVWAELKACRRPGETNAGLLMRFVMLLRLIGDQPQEDTHK